MPLSMTDTCERVAVILEDIEGLRDAVFRPSTDGKKKIPDGLTVTPAVIVLPGEDTEYILNAGHHRHGYYLRLLFCFGGGDIGFAAANGLPFVDRAIEAFTTQVTLTGRATYCHYYTQLGYSDITWGGITYNGYEVQLRVSEQANITAEAGDL